MPDMQRGPKINDGGPAFPQTTVDHFGGTPSVTVTGGMTLRDWFAGQALAGLAADEVLPLTADEAMELAAGAYFVADAMLAERERR